MTEDFKTILSASQGEYKEKGSKFLAFAYPVQEEEHVKQRLEELKKEYHDARHHCYAFIINPSGDQFRAADDGEPSHSAGDPILGQIRSFGITNTLVVVVRYFGGTKLGVGGLANAYRTAAYEALNNAVIIEEKVRVPFNISYSYDATNEVMRLINDLDMITTDHVYDVRCCLHGKLAIGQKLLLQEKITLLKDLGNDVQLEIG